MKHGEYKGILLMLACAVMWSMAGLCIKLVPWNSMVLAGWRSISATLTLVVALKLMKYKITVDGRTLLIGFFVSVTSFLFIMANKLTTAANAIVLQYTSPVFLVLLSAVFFRLRYRLGDYAAVIIAVAGIALIFLDEFSAGGALGNVLGLIDGACLASVYLLTGESDEPRRLSGILIGLVFTAVIGIPFTFAYPIETLTLPIAGLVALMGIFQIGLPYALYSIAINYCPPLACSLISSMEIVLSPLWVWLFINETPDKYAFIGSAVIVVTITVWCALGGAKPRNAAVREPELK